MSLTIEEYEERKSFLDDLKRLVKAEQEAIFRILVTDKEEYSENSNGIFFDISKLSKESFKKMKDYMEFCRKTRDTFKEREEEERQVQEFLGNLPA